MYRMIVAPRVVLKIVHIFHKIAHGKQTSLFVK